MPTLSDMLGVEPNRGAVVEDACRVLDQEVSDKSGLGGLAIKAAYGVIKGIKPGFVREVVDGLLDEFLKSLEPFYQDALARGAKPSVVLQSNASGVADALLAVTDGKAARAQRPVIEINVREAASLRQEAGGSRRSTPRSDA